MHDVLDAISARIKAPYFGYALLAFIGLNWRGMFLLTVTNGSPQERLAAFDAQTSAWSLVVLPLLVGGLVTLVSPWVRLGFGLLSKRPFEHIDNLHLDSDHSSRCRFAARLNSGVSPLCHPCLQPRSTCYPPRRADALLHSLPESGAPSSESTTSIGRPNYYFPAVTCPARRFSRPSNCLYQRRLNTSR